MKFTKIALVLLSFVIFSCQEQESIEPDQQSNAEIIDEGKNEAASIDFSFDRDNGLETNMNIQFQNDSKNLVEYSWDFGDGTGSEDESVIHAYSDAGKYTVTLRGKTAGGQELSMSKKLYVRENGAELDILFVNYQDSTLNYFDINTKTLYPLYKVPYNPAGVLALDKDNRKVYYFDYTNNLIIENSLEIDNPVVLFSEMAGVSDMEFDPITRALYIALSYDDLILKYDPLTLTTTSVVSSIGGGKFGKVRDMTLKSGHLYTITPTQSYESVFKVDVDMGRAAQVISYESGGFGYGVALDDFNEKLYFNNVERSALMRSDLDGNNIEMVIDLDRLGKVSFAALCLTGLRVVETRNQLMWSAWDQNTLHFMDLETMNEETITVDGLYGKFIPFENVDFTGL